MKRIAITNQEGYWFDAEKAEQFDEESYWNGRNFISKATGNQWEHETLFKTRSGKWVLNHWSNFQGSLETYVEIDEEAAATWFLKQGMDLPEGLEKFAQSFEI